MCLVIEFTARGLVFFLCGLGQSNIVVMTGGQRNDGMEIPALCITGGAVRW